MITFTKELNNELQEIKGNIRVYCRVRPFLPIDGDENIQTGSIITTVSETNLKLEVPNAVIIKKILIKYFNF